MSYKIIAKYIKKLDFDISKPNMFFSLTKDISNYKFKIDIKRIDPDTKPLEVRKDNFAEIYEP